MGGKGNAAVAFLSVVAEMYRQIATRRGCTRMADRQSAAGGATPRLRHQSGGPSQRALDSDRSRVIPATGKAHPQECLHSSTAKQPCLLLLCAAGRQRNGLHGQALTCWRAALDLVRFDGAAGGTILAVRLSQSLGFYPQPWPCTRRCQRSWSIDVRLLQRLCQSRKDRY